MPITRDRRLELLESYDPALSQANLRGFIEESTKTVRVAATNATALGLTDVQSVVAIQAFVTASGAVAAKCLLDSGAGNDFTVANGDVTPVGDHSTETWLISYRV